MFYFEGKKEIVNSAGYLKGTSKPVEQVILLNPHKSYKPYKLNFCKTVEQKKFKRNPGLQKTLKDPFAREIQSLFSNTFFRVYQLSAENGKDKWGAYFTHSVGYIHTYI